MRNLDIILEKTNASPRERFKELREVLEAVYNEFDNLLRREATKPVYARAKAYWLGELGGIVNGVSSIRIDDTTDDLSNESSSNEENFCPECGSSDMREDNVSINLEDNVDVIVCDDCEYFKRKK